MYTKAEQTGKSRQRKRAEKALKIPESSLQSICDEYLDTLGITYLRIPDALYRAIFASHSIKPYIKKMISDYVKGRPDTTILHPDGRYLCVELKSAKGKQTQGQKNFAKRIPVTVVRDFDTFQKIVDKFIGGKA